jgi:anti-sigma regulatory factor (Ser/Thr protein kinase)
MSSTAIEADVLVSLVLLKIPGQVSMARCLVQAALDYCGLEHHADNAKIITSELVTNAMQHASPDPAEKIGVTLMRIWGEEEAVAVVVTDSSPTPPVRLNTTADSTHGRGLQVVEALSVHWGWHSEVGGKAVYAVLAEEKSNRPSQPFPTSFPEGAERAGGMSIVADISGFLWRRSMDTIPRKQATIVGANIRILRQHKGWTQTRLAALMGWRSTSTVCAAEGHRGEGQRGFTLDEVERLAAIFGVSPSQLTTRCANCGGQPPACLSCGAAPSENRPALTVATDTRTHPLRHDAEARP